MQISRTYKNAGGDIIRVDELSLSIMLNEHPATTYKREGSMVRLGPQRIKTIPVHSTATSRLIAGLEITGDFDTVDEVSGDYAWAEKTLGDGTVACIDMSGLPGIGDTI